MKLAPSILTLASVVWLYLLITDTRVFISEKKVNPGEQYFADSYGDLGAYAQASLVCRYFNGRKVLQSVYRYASNNFMGKDSCPFIFKE